MSPTLLGPMRSLGDLDEADMRGEDAWLDHHPGLDDDWNFEETVENRATLDPIRLVLPSRTGQ